MSQNDEQFCQELIRTDVTAVKLFKQHILAGIGSNLYVFKQNQPKTFIARVNALNGQKIYGLVPSKCLKKILVYGGKQYTVLSIDNIHEDVENQIQTLFEPIVCDDWLHSALWIDRDETVAVLTAHNVVQIWDTTTHSLVRKHCSTDNSILYSGLIVPLQGSVLVMAGTVFSEVIIHCIDDNQLIHRLKGHKGVIFSISCYLQRHLIVTTSDDRSVRIWGPNDLPKYSVNSIQYWKSVVFNCKYTLYGHTARVMRSCITDNCVISVGEDSAICYWSYAGELLKRNVTHRNGGIWAVDASNEYTVTGGGDCAVILQPIVSSEDSCVNDVVNIKIGTPKKVLITKRKNLVILNETGLIYYDVLNKIYTDYELKHESTYKMLVMDKFREVIAVADMTGKLDMYEEETSEGMAELVNIVDTKLNIGRILSMLFITRDLLAFSLENGFINVFVKKDLIELCDEFVLPHCKERWFTAAAKHDELDLFVFGDRCGNLHIYLQGQENPVKSFSRVHGRYGPTSINVDHEQISTTGRDGTVKYFAFDAEKLTDFKYMRSRNLEFEWVEKFLDSSLEIVCGFRERLFVICDLHSNTNIVEIPCGGGHRSWDIIAYNDNFKECIQFVYIKNSDIITATVHKTRIRPIRVIDSWHSKEINCLKTYRSDKFDTVFYISGAEDTTLRITEGSKLCSFKERAEFKNLSSVKAIKVYHEGNDEFLILTAGGRAQICVKKVSLFKYPEVTTLEVVNYLIKGTDRERKGVKSWLECTTDFDPETRVMDIDLIRVGEGFLVFAGCSDAVLRIFSFKHHESSSEFKVVTDIKHHKTCILKTKCVKICNEDLLITCTTTGELTVWDISQLKRSILEPFLTIKIHKSGINSIIYTLIAEDQILIATGGDDNAIHLNLLQFPDRRDLCSLKVVQQWSSPNYHSSQITGLCFVDRYMLSASIDQRVTLFEWKVSEKIICKFISQHWTDISDVHGLELLEYCGNSIKICVFGKGMEVLPISVPSSVVKSIDNCRTKVMA